MLTMQKVALMSVAFLISSHGRRTQAQQNANMQDLDPSDALTKLLLASNSPVAFNSHSVGSGQSTLRPTSVNAQHRIGRNMKMQEGDLEDDIDWGDIIVVNDDSVDEDLEEFLPVDEVEEPLKLAMKDLSKLSKSKNYLGKRKVKMGMFAQEKDELAAGEDENDVLTAMLSGEDDEQTVEVPEIPVLSEEQQEDFPVVGYVAEFLPEGVGLYVDGEPCLLTKEGVAGEAVALKDLFEIGQPVEVKFTGEEAMIQGDEEPVKTVALIDLTMVGYYLMQEAMDNDKSLEGTLVDVDEAGRGVVLMPGGVFGHIDPAQDRDFDPEELMHKTIPVKVVGQEIVHEFPLWIVSNRRAVVENAIDQMEVGKVVQGTVRTIMPYGLFVDISGMSGLLHLSQISNDHVEDPTDIFPVGSTIKAMVINCDKLKGRVAISTKTLEAEPGDILKDKEQVFANAEQTALKYQERMEEERKAREEAAQDVLFGLESLTQNLGLDPKDLDMNSLGLGASESDEQEA